MKMYIVSVSDITVNDVSEQSCILSFMKPLSIVKTEVFLTYDIENYSNLGFVAIGQEVVFFYKKK